MLYVGEGLRGSNGACSTLCRISVTPSATHNQIGPLWCWFLSGWACACSRPLGVSPMNSPVRLGVSPAASSTPRDVFNQRFEALFPYLEPWVVQSASLPCHSSRFIYTPMWGRGVCQPPPCGVRQLPPCRESSPPSCPSPPLLLVWVNISSLTPWLLDFHAVQFSGSLAVLPMPPSWFSSNKVF